MNKQVVHYLIYCTVFFMMLAPKASAASVDPLSKIIITSSSAVCTKAPQNTIGTQNPDYVFQYQGNVIVTFADASTVSADTLDIVFNGKQLSQTKKQKHGPTGSASLQNFRQITFKGNVHVKSKQRTIHADKAYFYLSDQKCIFDGHVKIVQNKEKPTDVPVSIQSQKAELNVKTGQVNLLGSVQEPVSTTIILEGHPALQAKKKKEMKQQRGPFTPTPSLKDG